MKKFISTIICFSVICSCVFSFSSCNNQKNNTNQKQKFTVYYFDYFDTVTTIVGYEKTKEEFDSVCENIKAELNEYHRLCTIYNSYENVNNLCSLNKVKNGAHQKLQVDKKIIDLLLFCKDFYNKTSGTLNVAMGSVLSIWHDYREKGMNKPSIAKIPPMEDLKEAANHTDINSVIIDEKNSTVFIADPSVKLDVGAVAKGYAVEMVAQSLISKGVDGYILNVGGNVRAIGSGNGAPWQVGIENPDTESENKYIKYLKIENKSLVTSGSYQRFFTVNGKNYHHIIDPHTLMPGEKYMSVSVLSDNSGVADALSTTLFLMDFNEGLKLVEATDNTEAMWVFADGEIKTSSEFEAYTYEKE